jgi:hypothetical protein
LLKEAQPLKRKMATTVTMVKNGAEPLKFEQRIAIPISYLTLQVSF